MSDDKPRISYRDGQVTSVTRKAGQRAKDQAEGFGYLVAVAVPWIAREFVPVPIPEEVLSAFSAYALSVAVRVKEHIL